MKFVVVVVSIFCFVQTYASTKYNFNSKIKSSIKRPIRSGRILGKQSLSQAKCVSIAKTQLKNIRKKIIPFAVGTTITSEDIYGEFSHGYLNNGFGKYAKRGLPDNHTYKIKKLQSQFAIHSDTRCQKYVVVKKVDQSVYKSKRCRRVTYKIGKHLYKALFCLGEKIAYVDHFNLSRPM